MDSASIRARTFCGNNGAEEVRRLGMANIDQIVERDIPIAK